MEFLKEIRGMTKEDLKEAITNRESIRTGGKTPGIMTALNMLSGRYDDYIGYTVITDKRKIVCALNNDADCCENWDAELKEEENKKIIKSPGCKIELNVDDVDGDYDEGSAVELKIIESKKTSIIKLWNSHNGYYAHDYLIYDTSGELTCSGLI